MSGTPARGSRFEPTWRRLGTGTAGLFLVIVAFLAGRMRGGADPALATSKTPARQPQAQIAPPAESSPDPGYGYGPGNGSSGGGTQSMPADPQPAGDPRVMTRIDDRFPTMGGTATVRLESDEVSRDELERSARVVRDLFADVEATLSRFRPESELNALNADPRPAVPASPLLRQLANAVRWAGSRSGGLVDGTLLDDIEGQGYVTTLAGSESAPLADALAAAPARRPARPHPARDYARVHVDDEGRVSRRAGVRIDSGGLGKGMAADLAAAALHPGIRYAVGCGGDLAVGGPGRWPWQIAVTGAHTGGEVHRLLVRAGGIATSGIQARLWRRPDGSYAHHLLDPRTGEPAWTGLVAVTAVAANALEAEVLAKTALLSGPAGARRLLGNRGGVLQHDDGRVEVIFGPPAVRLPRPGAKAAA